MNRSLFISFLICCGTLAFAAAPTPQREILICVSDAAPQAIKDAADGVNKAVHDVPALAGLLATQGVDTVERLSSERVLRDYNRAAYNHLVVIGLPSDPLMNKVWEHYADVDTTAKTLYAQGWGYLQGDLGYLEADRNPFLHSRRIKSATFETVLFKISGTSEAGVLAAVKAFTGGQLNGIVPAGEWKRPKTTILDMDPNAAPAPVTLPAELKYLNANGVEVRALLAGWTPAPGNEYRAYIDLAGAEPVGVWREKYLLPGALARAQTPGWMAGFHRMAYGNAVNIVAFATPDAAKKTAEVIAAGGGWTRLKEIAAFPCWQAAQPTDENMATALGAVTLTWHDRYLMLTTLPVKATKGLLTGCVFPDKGK